MNICDLRRKNIYLTKKNIFLTKKGVIGAAVKGIEGMVIVRILDAIMVAIVKNKYNDNPGSTPGNDSRRTLELWIQSLSDELLQTFRSYGAKKMFVVNHCSTNMPLLRSL